MTFQIIKGKKEFLDNKAVEIIELKIKELLKKKDKVIIGVPGGRSVKGIYENFLFSSIDFNNVTFVFVDERFVDLTDEQSNYKILQENLIQPLEDEGISLDVEPFEYQKGVEEYNKRCKDKPIDILILGVGEDGHIASLFPHHDSLDDTSSDFITIKDAPKPPQERMSISKERIQKSPFAILLFYGEEKKKALDNFLSSDIEVQDCPAKLTSSIPEVYVLVD